MNSTLKNTQRYFCGIHRFVLTRMHRTKKGKENDTFCTSSGRDDQIATNAKLLDITYESYGFSTDLLVIIN